MTEYRQSMAGVTEGQFYFLVSTGPSYCNGKVVYNTKPTEGAWLRWGDKTIDENAMWEFVKTADDDNTYLLPQQGYGALSARHEQRQQFRRGAGRGHHG